QTSGAPPAATPRPPAQVRAPVRRQPVAVPASRAFDYFKRAQAMNALREQQAATQSPPAAPAPQATSESSASTAADVTASNGASPAAQSAASVAPGGGSGGAPGTGGAA